MLGQGEREGEKGEKRSEGKGEEGREGKNESYRAALDIEFVLSIVLPSIQRYYVQHTQLSSAIDTATSVSIYERLPEVTADEFLFETPERERERVHGFAEGIELHRSRRAGFREREREREYNVRFVRDCTRAYFEFRLEFRFAHFRNGNGYSAFRKDFVLYRVGKK